MRELADLPAIGAVDRLALFLAEFEPSTRAAYSKDLGKLALFLGTLPSELVRPSAEVRQLALRRAVDLFTSLSAGDASMVATGFKRWLTEQGLAPSSIARPLSCLRMLARVARRHQWVDWSIEVRGPKVKPYLDVRGPGQAGYDALLDAACRRAKKSAAGRRDLAILLLFHVQLMRRGTVTGLWYPRDFELETNEPAVWGVFKGYTQRERRSLGETVAVALHAWLGDRGHWEGPMWIRLDRGAKESRAALSDNAIWSIVARTLSRHARLVKPARPHGLRHQAATELAAKTKDMRLVQEGLGHKNLATAQYYLDAAQNLYFDAVRVLDKPLPKV